MPLIPIQNPFVTSLPVAIGTFEHDGHAGWARGEPAFNPTRGPVGHLWFYLIGFMDLSAGNFPTVLSVNS